jgi:RNA polymerase sigma-70 factor (ECF subfamily)
MADKPTGKVTQLLIDCREGKQGAIDALLPLVYDELRRLAAYYMKSERAEHTLQPTALVHEAYAKLVGLDVDWQDRVQFFKAAAQAMRRVLVDHARAKASTKRGGDSPTLSLAEASLAGVAPVETDLLDLDRALDKLATVDERKAQVVELHFFGGLSFEEAGQALGISRATVDRDMRMARAWLHAELSDEAAGGV